MKLGKEKIEKMCREAGMKPVERSNFKGYELFVADGFSAPPHWKFRHFGVGPQAYPLGAYFTLWWVSKGEEKLDAGAMIHCDALHDPGHTKEHKQKLRINTAIKEATDFLEKRKVLALNGAS